MKYIILLCIFAFYCIQSAHSFETINVRKEGCLYYDQFEGKVTKVYLVTLKPGRIRLIYNVTVWQTYGSGCTYAQGIGGAIITVYIQTDFNIGYRGNQIPYNGLSIMNWNPIYGNASCHQNVKRSANNYIDFRLCESWVNKTDAYYRCKEKGSLTHNCHSGLIKYSPLQLNINYVCKFYKQYNLKSIQYINLDSANGTDLYAFTKMGGNIMREHDYVVHFKVAMDIQYLETYDYLNNI